MDTEKTYLVEIRYSRSHDIDGTFSDHEQFEITAYSNENARLEAWNSLSGDPDLVERIEVYLLES